MNDKPLESVTASVLVHEGGSYRVDKGKPVKTASSQVEKQEVAPAAQTEKEAKK